MTFGTPYYATMKYSSLALHSGLMKQQEQDGGVRTTPNTRTTVLSMQ
jgi:hypothetical protein